MSKIKDNKWEKEFFGKPKSQYDKVIDFARSYHLNEDEQMELEFRAAFMEYDGNLLKEQAELAAIAEYKSKIINRENV